jgi:photosystem II stability/assembly factor-like uncharacterized protein
LYFCVVSADESPIAQFNCESESQTMIRKFLLLLLILTSSVLVNLGGNDQATVTAAHPADLVSEVDKPWQMVPGPTGGSIAAVAISPDFVTDQTAYVAVRGRGVYRSKDGGYNWQPASPDGWYGNDLLLSPNFPNDQTLFVTHGLPTVSTSVQRSTDGGLTWQPANFVDPVTNGRSLVISPAFTTDQTLYLVTGDIPQLSLDGGINFSAAGGWFSTHMVDALALATDQILFAAAAGVSGEGIFRSENGGTDWVLVRSGSFTAVAASPAYAADNIILALDSSGQLHRSTNGGANWTTPALIVSSGDTETIAFSPTFASDNVVLVASSLAAGPYISVDGGLTWTESGWYDPADKLNNGLIGGAVFDLAPSPNQDYSGVLLAATSVGVARSHDGGDSWRQANGGLPALAVRALASAPGAEDTLLAGTAYFENLRVSTNSPDEYDGNLQLSTDGGRTWRVTSERLQQLTAVAFSPDFANDETAFAAAGTFGQHSFFDGGVYRSMNGGENWQVIFANQVILDLAVSPSFANDQTVWVAAWTYSGSSGIYRSTNGGDSWSPTAPGIAATKLVVSPDFASDQTLLAATSKGLQKSGDGGSSWNPVGPAEEVTAVTISPLYGASRTILIATADALHRSTDGGASWETIDIGLPATQATEPLRLTYVSYALDGSLLAAGYYGNLAHSAFVRRSSDAGDTWEAAGAALATDRVYELLTKPANSFLVTAAANNGLQQVAIEQGAAAEQGVWSSSGPRGGQAMTLAVSPDFASDGIAFGGEWMANFQGSALGLGPRKSGDYGQTWQATPSDIPYSDPVLDYGLSPNFAADNTVFAATWGDVLKSTDGGQTWTATGLMSGSLPGFIYRVAAAPDYSSSGLVLAGSDYYGEQLYVSRDAGATWEDPQDVAAARGIAFSPDFASDQTLFAAGATGISKSDDVAVSWTSVLTKVVRSLAISPDFANDQTLFAGGANSPDTAVFYRSVDGGSSWISRTIAADIKFINALAPSPAYASDKTLFAGTNAGLFWSEDGGDSWLLIDAYMGQNVHSLAISPAWPGHALLLVGLDDGVYRLLSSNPAAGIVRQATRHFTALPSNPLSLSGDGLLLTASANHDVYASEDGGASWGSRGLGGGFYSFTDVAASPAYAVDQTLFAAKSRSDGIGSTLYRSQDGGTSWSGVLSSDFVSDLAISPGFANDQTLFAATNEKALQRSMDGGTTWSDMGTWPVSKRGAALQVALPPNFATDETIFAGGSQGFWRLTPGETVWQTAVSGLTDSHRILALAVSPAYATDQTLLALASWSNPPDYTLHYGVFTSSDGGLNWTQVGTGLPDESLVGLTFSPHLATDNLAYVTTRAGALYRSRDRGSSWTLVGKAPDRPSFADVVVDEQGDVFVASDTGVWRYKTSQYDIVIDGGFETQDSWTLPGTPKSAQYSETVVFDGRHAMQIGNVGGDNGAAYSSARQAVTVPVGTKMAKLMFYTYSVSGDVQMAEELVVFPPNQVGVGSPASVAEPARVTSGDAQYALILDPGNDNILETLFWEQANGQTWHTRTYDLSAYTGQTIWLHYGVYNDGSGGHTGLVIDNVSLLVDAEISRPHAVYLPVLKKPY